MIFDAPEGLADVIAGAGIANAGIANAGIANVAN